MQYNVLTDMVYLHFDKNGQRVHLSTEESAASRMLEAFGEVGGDFPEYFSSRTHFAKLNSWSYVSPAHQVQQNIRPDLDPICLTLRWYFEKVHSKKTTTVDLLV